MAPRKRKAEESPAAAAVVSTARVTRSAALRASKSPSKTPLSPPEKKKKNTPAKKEESAQKKKKGARGAKKVEVENGNGVSELDEEETVKTTKTIVIEHCKQCQSFKRRAEEAKAGLSKGDSGINVIFNPDKPRRGCFEIREDGGEKFVTLMDLKRPFKKMKDLDMDKVVEDILKKIKC